MDNRNLNKNTGSPTGEYLINEVNLGDLLTLVSGEELTIRSIANFGKEIKTFTGFIILGECKYLLAIKRNKSSMLYKPTNQASLHKASRLLLEGSVKYWANHLPGLQGAMGELQFRVFEVPGSIYPWFVIYRGPEMIIFKPELEVDLEFAKIMFMPRGSTERVDNVVRHAVTIIPLTIEMPFVPEVVPVYEPEKEKTISNLE